jgi:tetratricopeptide (TPR) repeat protein
MHGTSRVREEGARLLATIVRAVDADGAAYGWTDALGPDLLVPVVRVGAPGVRWDGSQTGTLTVPVGEEGPLKWALMIQGIHPASVDRADTLIASATEWFAGVHDRDVPAPHPGVEDGTSARFIALLGGLRSVDFRIGCSSEVPSYRAAFAREIPSLPASAQPAALAAIDAMTELERLGPALLRLGVELDVAGALAEAVSVHGVAYELALRLGDPVGGMDAARWAGRGYRKLTDWSAAFHWYGLARRIAELEGDRARQARVLDGEGNTHRHRGVFPAARRSYEAAWELALASGDAATISSIAHSMMTIEREAGEHASAARYAWTALEMSEDRESRANLLLNIGTLLREAGALESAVAAYDLARAMTAAPEIRMMAADALAYCAAVGGDGDYDSLHAHARRAARGASAYLRAQMGYFRGAALQALGRGRDAIRVLRAVERYAASAQLHHWEVRAAELAESPLPQPVPTEAPVELRQGLSALRRELVRVPEAVG